MRITCPQCQFQGLIDTGPLAFDTRVVCVQCGTTFEALLVGGEIKTKLPADMHENLPLQPIMPAADLQVSEIVRAAEDPELEDVLVLPNASTSTEQIVEPAPPVLEDVLSVELADAWAAAQGNSAQEDAAALESENAFDESLPVVSDTRDASADEAVSSEMAPHDDKEDFALNQPQAQASVDLQNHGLGMRLMRISPVWLLVCGTTFVSVIILCNQLVKPAEPEPRVAASYSVSDNRAANQSLTQPSVPTSNKASATSVQDSSQVAAAAPVELKNEAKTVEQSAEPVKQSEPQAAAAPQPVAAAPKVVPAAETKSESAVSVPQSQDNSAGGFTIQVGSYNVIEQANERVSSMRAAGLDARVVAVELPKRGTWYRVQSGRFSSREEAQRYGDEARAKRAVDNFIVADAAGGK